MTQQMSRVPQQSPDEASHNKNNDWSDVRTHATDEERRAWLRLGRGLRGVITKFSAPSVSTRGLWLPAVISGPIKHPETGRDKPLPSRPAPAADRVHFENSSWEGRFENKKLLGAEITASFLCSSISAGPAPVGSGEQLGTAPREWLWWGRGITSPIS